MKLVLKVMVIPPAGTGDSTRSTYYLKYEYFGIKTEEIVHNLNGTSKTIKISLTQTILHKEKKPPNLLFHNKTIVVTNGFSLNNKTKIPCCGLA